MREIVTVRLLAISAFSLALSAPRVAFAQPEAAPALDDTASALTRNVEAVKLGREALQAYERGAWQSAYDQLERAESVAHSPVFLLYMARAKERLDAQLDALRIYDRVLGETTSATTPEAWRAATEAARAERTALFQRVPSLVVVLGPDSPTDTAVTLDGVALTRLGEELLVEPGVHVVVAKRADGFEVQQRLTVLEGQKRARVELRVPMPPLVAGTSSRRGAPKSSNDENAARGRAGVTKRPSTAVYVTGGAGLASLLFGIVAGTLAWNELRQLKDDCPRDRCQSGDANRLDSVRRLGTLADIGFSVGAAGLGTSALLFWLEPPTAGAGAPTGGIRFNARY